MQRSLRPDPYLLLLLALVLPALGPLFAPGYFFDAHDGRHSVFYLVQFDASLRDGAWWPRWAMHHIQGYGYPTFLIQAPLGFYLGELFVLLGAGFTTAVKLSWAVGVLAGAWGMYALVGRWLAEVTAGATLARGRAEQVRLSALAAVAAGLLYVYFPYHIADLYVRGALNDSLLLAWLPWLFLVFDRLLVDDPPTPERPAAAGDSTLPRRWTQRLAVAMLVLAATLLTHTFALLSILPLLITFVLFRLGQRWLRREPRPGIPATRNPGGAAPRRFPWRHVLLAFAAGVGGLALCAVFLAPLLAEGRYLQQQVYVTDTYDFRNHFVQVGQYFSPFWGFGYSDDPQGGNDGMGFQVGLLLIVLALGGLAVLRRKGPARPVLVYLLVLGAALLFVMTPLAQPVWEAVPPLAVIQFPWRLLALAGFVFSAAGGLTLARLAYGELGPSEELLPGPEPQPAGGLLVFGLLALLASWPTLQANLSPVEPWREDGRAVYRFEREHPDMIAYTQWVTQPFTTTALSAGYAAPDYTETHGATNSLQRLEIVTGQGEVLSNYSRGSSGGGVVRMDTPGVVQINEFYFPGWTATVDGLPAEIRPAPTGALLVDVPAGQLRIDARFGDTPPRQLGALISGIALIAALALLLWRHGPYQPTGAPF